MSLISDLIASALEMPNAFADVATADPVAGVMLALGGLLMALSLGYFGLLVLGVLWELVSPGAAGRSYPRAR